jgi:glycyl-tRNA synthetase beta subunit
MVMLHRHQALKSLLVVVSLPSDPKSGTKCAEITTKKVRNIMLKNIRTKADLVPKVERRRRETINEGINEIAKIVPGCEKNKGSILARAVQFITQLKDNETQNIEKWTLEKLLTEQAISELTRSCDKLKSEYQRAWSECEQWKKAAQKAGVNSIEGEQPAAGEDPE